MKMIILNIKNKYKYLDKKNKRLFLNTFFSLIIKAAAVLISLLILPAYMSYFIDNKILGLWFTALSVLSLVLTFDFGIGNGLRNNLAIAISKNDKINITKYISSAYIMVGSIITIVILVGYLVFYFIDWNRVFNISSEIIPFENLLEVIRIIFIGIMIQFFLKLVNSIMYALQKPALPSLLTLISSIILLIFVSFSEREDSMSNLKKLAYINVLAANLPLLISTVIIFSNKLKFAIPKLEYFDKSYALKIIRLGGLFFLLQIMFMIISNTNEFLISFLSKPENVVDFKIYNSIFGIVGTVFLLAITPVWSEVTDSYARNELGWIKKLYLNLYKIAIAGVIVLIILFFMNQIIINYWLGINRIQTSYNYSIVFVILGVLFMWNAILSSIANGIGKLKTAMIYLTMGAVLNIPLAYLFTNFFGDWIGVVVANIISLLPFCIMQTIWFWKFFKQKSISNTQDVKNNK